MEECKHCKNFVLHYYLLRNCRYMPTAAGHCAKKEFAALKKEYCALYEKADLSPRAQRINELAFKLSEILDEIKKLLRENDAPRR